MKSTLIFTITTLLAASVNAFNSIVVTGNAFYNGTDRFFIRGVDYQPGGSSQASDPLADEEGCKRDVAKFIDLGINTIRVYTVDNSANHDTCMNLLQDAGIFLLLDVNTPKNSINRADPAGSYNVAYLQSVFATIDAFKNYDNVLGFFAANEVINDANTSYTAPYVKAVVRDMKAYISKQSTRQIPVGYSAADISSNRWEQMCYFNCGNSSERIDMFGMNDYSWCGTGSSFQISGYQANVVAYGNYSIPMFFSEYGCNTVSPRVFDEIPSIYSDQMSSVYSGGLVYEYSQETSNYGLVVINGSNVTQLPDYNNFKDQLAKSPNPSGDAGASTSRKPASCPSFEAGVWEVTIDVPAMPSGALTYIENGAGKPLGLGAPSTQWSSNVTGNGTDTSSSASSASSSASGSAKKNVAAPGASIPTLFGTTTLLAASLLAASFILSSSI
jgi:hypothetical protein